jgi:hypothetical protein
MLLVALDHDGLQGGSTSRTRIGIIFSLIGIGGGGGGFPEPWLHYVNLWSSYYILSLVY